MLLNSIVFIMNSQSNENLKQTQSQENSKLEEEKNMNFKKLRENFEKEMENKPQRVIDPEFEKYKADIKQKIIDRAVGHN
jgi:thymidylate kinase